MYDLGRCLLLLSRAHLWWTLHANPQYSSLFNPQKFREYLEGSNLISKLQAKHDTLKKALAEGKTDRNSLIR